MGAAAKPIIFFSNGMLVPVALASAVAPGESGAQEPPPPEEEAAAKTVTVRCVLTESGAARVTVDGATRECVAL